MALDLPGLIRRLSAHDVAFVVIGGIAATMHGSAHVTYDLDIVYQRTPENIERLVRALETSTRISEGANASATCRWAVSSS